MKTMLVLLLLSTFSHAEGLTELDGLIARQNSDSGSCNKFRKKWQGVVKGGLTRESPAHVSKTQALDALKLLERFPFRGEAQFKAWSYLVDNRDALAKEPDQKAVLERVGRVTAPCETYSRSVHRELLLKDIAALAFSKKEKKNVARLSREYLKDDANSATLPGIGLKLRFLVAFLDKAYDGENKEALKVKAAALQKEFESGRDQAETESKQLSAGAAADTIAVRAPELRLWARCHEVLTALLGELES